jgi:hypothetical protein
VAKPLVKYVDVLGKKYHCNNVKVIPHGTFDSIEEPSFELTKEEADYGFCKFGTYKKVEILLMRL